MWGSRQGVNCNFCPRSPNDDVKIHRFGKRCAGGPKTCCAEPRDPPTAGLSDAESSMYRTWDRNSLDAINLSTCFP